MFKTLGGRPGREPTGHARFVLSDFPELSEHTGAVHAAQAAIAKALLSSARHALVVRLQLRDEPAFERWARENFDWSPDFARTIAAIGERFGADAGEAIEQFQAGSLFLLAAPEASEAAACAISLARKRTRITLGVAQRLIAGEKP